MTIQIQTSTQTLYDQDYQLWLQATIEQLRSGKFSDLDLENLIEELEGMTRSDRRALESLLTRLWEHLLKLIYWEAKRDYNANKWQAEIITFRIQIKKLLKDSPSLKPYLIEIFEECYLDACKVVSRLMGRDINTLPTTVFITLEQTLDEGWFPNVVSKTEEEEG